MMKLYHQVNAILNNAEKTLAVAQARQRGEKAEMIKKIEEEKDGNGEKLDNDLKERLDDVDSHFEEAMGKLKPSLDRYQGE